MLMGNHLRKLDRYRYRCVRRRATIKLFDDFFTHSGLKNEECLSLGKEVSRAVRLRVEQELQSM